jgi:hypothetical protein
MFVRMDRLINRRRQGDLGEASAIEWLTGIGATVLIPLGHSPHLDLVAEIRGRLLRVQVKTSVVRKKRPDGCERWDVSLTTNGGNQSWTGISKRFDPGAVDFLFVLVGDGRRWFIPTAAIESSTGVTLGGPAYSSFEIPAGRAIEKLVYGQDRLRSKLAADRGSADVGESGEAVNLVLPAEWVRIPPPPSSPSSSSSSDGSGVVDAGDPRSGLTADAPLKFQRTRISSAHQITIPSVPFRAASLDVGDRLHATACGEGRVLLERIEQSADQPILPMADAPTVPLTRRARRK